MNKQEYFELLDSTEQQAVEYFSRIEGQNKSYAPGKWSVRDILHHLTEAETVLFYRIRRVIAEGKQVIWDYNQDAWHNNLNYEDISLDWSKQQFLLTRQALKIIADKFYDGSSEKEFIHSATGLRTLKDEFDKVALHAQHHLNQIEQALNS